MELREPEEERIPRPLSALSQPPTEAELSRYEDVPLDKLPPAYFRNPQDRIYVNRDLRLDKIAFVGFDMVSQKNTFGSAAFAACALINRWRDRTLRWPCTMTHTTT